MQGPRTSAPEAATPSAADEDWVPPPHALPYGPFLALAALENLLAHDFILRLFISTLGKLST
jgi:leader peptidase (prepilin peptidase)/N-methyltransferase